MNLSENKYLKQKSEAELWIAFRNGDKTAFSYLYKKNYRKIYSYGINLGMDGSQVSDAIQDIFLKLYEKPEVITQPATLLPFLFRSIRNSFINTLKKNKSQTELDDSVIPFSFEYTIDELLIEREDETSLKNKVEEVLSCLTARQKEIIYFRFLYEMEYEEIARIMNISQQGARNMLYKAFEKIRKTHPHYLPLLLWLIKDTFFFC